MPSLHTLQLSYVRTRPRSHGIFVISNWAIGALVWFVIYLLVRLCL